MKNVEPVWPRWPEFNDRVRGSWEFHIMAGKTIYEAAFWLALGRDPDVHTMRDNSYDPEYMDAYFLNDHAKVLEVCREIRKATCNKRIRLSERGGADPKNEMTSSDEIYICSSSFEIWVLQEEQKRFLKYIAWRDK